MASLQDLQKQHGAAPPAKRSLEEIRALEPAKQFPAMLAAFKSQIAVALPEHLSADRMARVALTAFRLNPTLAKCEPMSVFQSVLLSAQLGLEIGVDGQAYLVPYKNTRSNRYECQFIPGWKGYVDLVNRAKQASVWTGAVFKGDHFEYELGDRPFVRHKPTGEADETKANLTHVYAIGRVHGADLPVIEVWPLAKVQRHLNRYNKVGDRHYALANDNNFIAYGRKVALLQVLKYMPKSVQLRAAQAVETHGAAAADLRDVLEGSWENVTDAVSASVEPEGQDKGEPQQAEAQQAEAQQPEPAQAEPTPAKPAPQRRTLE